MTSEALVKPLTEARKSVIEQVNYEDKKTEGVITSTKVDSSFI